MTISTLMLGGALLALSPAGLPLPVQVVLALMLVVPLGPMIYRLAYQPIAGASVLALLIVAVFLIPAIAIASLPADIRGYGPVKLESVKKAEARLELLEKEFQKAVPAAKVA